MGEKYGDVTKWTPQFFGGGRLYHGDCFCKASLRVKLCMISMAENCELAPGKCLSPENK